MAKLSIKAAKEKLATHALTYPEAWRDNPWGDDVVKVGKKMFVAFGGDEKDAGEFSMSVKLPVSAEMALTLPWVEPTGYGLGKSGWVTARLPKGSDFDIATMKGWIDQSYRAVAPKTLVKKLSD